MLAHGLMLPAMVFTGFALAVHVPADEKEHGAQHEGEGSEDEAEEVSHWRPPML